MKRPLFTGTLFVTALLAASPAANAADQAVSFGLFGGYLVSDSLEAIGDTPLIAPRVGYWINPSLGFELDLGLMPAGRTQVGVPDPFPYFGALPLANVVGRIQFTRTKTDEVTGNTRTDDAPIALLLNVGLGPFFKRINDDGALGLPTGTKMDVDFAGAAGPGLLVPFGNVALRTEYRWMLNIGSENWANRGDSFLNGMWTLGVMYLPTGPKDSDKDGITDDVDRCIDEMEDMDEFEDDDGCPELDNDGDGIADIADACRNEAEDIDTFQDEDGCPDLDNDGDTIADIQDACPLESGSPKTKGCPDKDDDLLIDADDECPEEPGPHTAAGCPDRDEDRVPDYRDECPDEAAPADIDPARSNGCIERFYIAEDKIVITEMVQFDTGRASIKKTSNSLLDGLAGTLEKNPGIKRLQIEGHTDSDGDDAKNLKLSQERADSVKAYFVGKGIVEARLVAIGYGETKPVGDNATKAGKEQNRRVEFNILEQDVGKRLKKKLEGGNDKPDGGKPDGVKPEGAGAKPEGTGAKPVEKPEAPAAPAGSAAPAGAKPAETPAAKPAETPAAPAGAGAGAKPAETPAAPAGAGAGAKPAETPAAPAGAGAKPAETPAAPAGAGAAAKPVEKPAEPAPAGAAAKPAEPAPAAPVPAPAPAPK